MSNHGARAHGNDPGACAHSCCSSNPEADPLKVRDPVCGMSIDPAPTAYHAQFEGHDHHFCWAGCRTNFTADPHRYLHPAKPAQSQRAVPGAQYTCPMHPEIIRDVPGSCPICGMAWNR